jgi:hypothetical protein
VKLKDGPLFSTLEERNLVGDAKNIILILVSCRSEFWTAPQFLKSGVTFIKFLEKLNSIKMVSELGHSK